MCLAILRRLAHGLSREGFGFRGWGLGLRVWGLGFKVWGLRFPRTGQVQGNTEADEGTNQIRKGLGFRASGYMVPKFFKDYMGMMFGMI